MPRTAVICLLITLLAWGTQKIAFAQPQHQQNKDVSAKSDASDQAKSEETVRPKEGPKPLQAYRLDFALHELQDGNKTNSRHYSMNLTGGSGDEIKIGTRVPVATGSSGPAGVGTQFQYMDVGTTIWAILREAGDDWQLQVKSETSDLDMNRAKEHGTEFAPIVRQMKIEGSTLLVTGKPMLIGTLDDPNSTRQFQLEVTATRLK